MLVACEFSGHVREAFRVLGHDAWSCDLMPALDNSPFHLQCDVLGILNDNWDLMVAHPPCTFLCVAGRVWMHHPDYPQRWKDQLAAIQFVEKLWAAPIRRIAIENPKGVLSTHLRKPDQVIQPWQHGTSLRKATHLWLQRLPLLVPSNMVEHGPSMGVKEPEYYPGLTRARRRSVTFPGVATAMANQWGVLPVLSRIGES